MWDGHVGVRKLTANLHWHVGWGKTRGQRAPHPNTSSAHNKPQARLTMRLGPYVGLGMSLGEFRNPTKIGGMSDECASTIKKLSLMQVLHQEINQAREELCKNLLGH